MTRSTRIAEADFEVIMARLATIEALCLRMVAPEHLEPPDGHFERMAAIQRVVAKEFGLSVRNMMTARKFEHVAWPRQVAMYLCRLHKFTFLEIGLHFYKDHGTVLHGCNAVRARIETDATAREQVKRLKELLTPPQNDA